MSGRCEPYCEHTDYSLDRARLSGDALDRALWLLGSEGWDHDAAMLEQYVAEARSAAIASVLDVDRVAAALHAGGWGVDEPGCTQYISGVDLDTGEAYQHRVSADTCRHASDHRALALRVVAALTGGQG